MSPEEGCEAFERLIYRRPGSQVVESTGDLETRIDQWIRRQSLRSAADSLSQKKTTLYARPHLQTAYIPTSNDVEEKIAHIWQQVLGIENVGIHDNYFDLGGTSLSALQVIAQLQKEFSVPVSPIVLFEASTVSELSKRLQPNRGKADNETLKKAVARRRAGRQTRQANSEIAIVGMAGRFPGANSVNELWQNLLNGVEALSYFSDEELLEARVDPAQLSHPDYVKARPILQDIDRFDAGFFGYSPRDAEMMDPQHRLMLEIAWEALESAGCDSLRISVGFVRRSGAAAP
jgi:acyl carrier protein